MRTSNFIKELINHMDDKNLEGSEGFYEKKDGTRDDQEMLHNTEAMAHMISPEDARARILEMRTEGIPEDMIKANYEKYYTPPKL